MDLDILIGKWKLNKRKQVLLWIEEPVMLLIPNIHTRNVFDSELWNFVYLHTLKYYYLKSNVHDTMNTFSGNKFLIFLSMIDKTAKQVIVHSIISNWLQPKIQFVYQVNLIYCIINIDTKTFKCNQLLFDINLMFINDLYRLSGLSE